MTGDKTLATLVQLLYGVSTSPLINNMVSAVGVTAIQIASTNPRRLGITIVNNGLAALYILPEPGVTAARGIYIAPAGGSISMRWDIDFELVSNAWYAIAAGAANDITVLENISL